MSDMSGYARDRTPMKCNLCGQIWDRINPAPCSHTQAEWNNYKTANGISDQDFAKWTPQPS